MTPDNNSGILQLIVEIQAGNTQAREDFLAEYKPFVAKTAMSLCKRPLEWGFSDELSIALIAFNAAIDAYDTRKRVPFLPYARVVIQNRLKDYFRKESRLRTECPLDTETDDGKTVSPAEIQASWTDYRERTLEDERQEELEEYEKLLSSYGIDFEALADTAPKHKDSRQTLFRAAKIIVSDDKLMEHLIARKQLPLNELMAKTGINRKTLERGRKFIIATALVLYYSMDFPYIRTYINV